MLVGREPRISGDPIEGDERGSSGESTLIRRVYVDDERSGSPQLSGERVGLERPEGRAREPGDWGSSAVILIPS